MSQTTRLRVCHIDALLQGQPRCYRVAGRDLLLLRQDEQLYALDNRCGHAGAPLHKGDYSDGLIVCPLHGAAFDLRSGAVEWPAILPPPMAGYSASDDPRLRRFGELLEAIETLPIRRYPVSVTPEGEVYVSLDSRERG